MNHTLLFFLAALYKNVILIRRYLFNTVSQIITFYLFFALIFFGGQQVAGPNFTNSLEGILVGYFLWMLIMTAYSSIAGDITNEVQWGTLEQLYMSPLGIERTIGVMTVTNVLVSSFTSVVLLIVMLLTTQQTLQIDLVTVIPITIATVVPAIGLGYAFGGLALHYKQISDIFRLIQFVFVGLLAAPVDAFSMLKVLPFSQGSYMLREAMTEGTSISEFPVVDRGILAGVALCYFAVGYVIFQRIQLIARKRGVLGDY